MRRAYCMVCLLRPSNPGSGRHPHDERAHPESTAIIGPPGSSVEGYRDAVAKEQLVLEIAGREVTVTNPSKVYFPDAGYTKGDVVRYYQAVADGALAGIRSRPMALKRFVDGIAKEPFFQKRAPDNTPEWLATAELTFPSGR